VDIAKIAYAEINADFD